MELKNMDEITFMDENDHHVHLSIYWCETYIWSSLPPL
jgi:hypothetical protein